MSTPPVTLFYVDYNVQRHEVFPTYKEAKARANELAKLGHKGIRIVRPIGSK